MKNQDILLEWLQTLPSGSVVVNANVPIVLQQYGQLYYNKMTSPDTYSRLWRQIRNETNLLERHGISLKEITTGKTTKWILQNTWKSQLETLPTETLSVKKEKFSIF